MGKPQLSLMALIHGLFLLWIAVPANKLQAQSPFDYGQNEAVYFLSSKERSNWAIGSIQEVLGRKEGDTGGMHENWDLTEISFGETEISDSWYPAYMDSNYVYDLESLIDSSRFLNGTFFQLTDGRLSSYGGGGYGTFDQRDILRLSDSLSIVEIRCVGHCGSFSLSYSKNVFSRGRLLYTVFYQKEIQEDGEVFEGKTEEEFDVYLKKLFPQELDSDTSFVHYNDEGLFLAENNQRNWIAPPDGKHPFRFKKTAHSGSKFYQCYMEMEEMEQVIKDKLGYLPKAFLMEIDTFSVFTFVLHPQKNIYLRTQTIVLEK